MPADIVSYEHVNSKKLLLRKATIRDVDDIFEIRCNPQIFRYLDKQIDATKEMTKSYLARINKGHDEYKWIHWVIECKENRKVIGTISLSHIDDEESSARVSFLLHPGYQGQGYMQEALDAVAMISFDKLGLKKLVAITAAKNKPAVRLLENVDFQFIGSFRKKDTSSNKHIPFKKYVLVNEYNLV